MSRKTAELYEFGSFRLNVTEHILEATNGDKVGSVPEKHFQTLVHLVRNFGHLVTKQELLSAVWSGAIVEENNLDKAIHSLRQTLGEKPGEQKYIETVRKHGYRFVADVRSVETGRFSRSGAHAIVSLEEWERLSGDVAGADAADDINNNEEPPVVEEPRKARPGRKYFALAAVGLAAVLAAVGGWYLFGGTKPTNGEKISAANIAGPEPVEKRPSLAYDLYVRGKVKVASESRDETEAAIELLEEAIAIDPNYAAAYAQLARGYNTMAFKYTSEAERKRFHENAEVAIEKAFALEPNLAEAHFARGLILWTNTRGFPHEQSIQSYKRSLALYENSDETHHQLTLVYSHIGLLNEAEASINRAIEINPNNTLARFRRGVNMAYQGKFEEAIAVYKTIPRDFTPLLVERSIAEALIQTGRIEEAHQIADGYLERFPRDEGGSFNSVKALILAKAGRHAEAQAAMTRAVEIGRDFGHFHHTAYNIASAYAAMGRPEEAVRWLERAADGGFPNYAYFDVDPNLQGLRSHPGFVEFMAKLKTRWERFKAGV